MPSLSSPSYHVEITTKSNKYTVTNPQKGGIVTNLTWSDSNGGFAASANISIANLLINGVYLSSDVKVGSKIAIYADVGNGKKEVFRGTMWDKKYKSAKESNKFYGLCINVSTAYSWTNC